ncbi:MAG: M23 family metallopeptidase [Lachnospiraceae bacterium]|nr:M23 family metallopeptidase [Lachnospiraceae bacterium]
MKKQKISVGRRNLYAAIFSCALVAAVYAGVMWNIDRANDIARLENSADINIEESESVSLNKNADPKSISSDNVSLDSSDIDGGELSSSQASANEVASEDTDESVSASISSDQSYDETEEVFFEDMVFLSPIKGDIVMDYSIDNAIYDVTLDQYRTNDSVCINAEAGSPVLAAAAGEVEEISYSFEKGNTVTINHGNGWRTTYGQLDGKITVNVGDQVSAGQEIGTVGSPTIYTVLLGDHLDFKVSRDGQSLDPKLALGK